MMKMANEIMKTGRMYLVWDRNPEVQTQAGGIEIVIESIGRTDAKYAWCTEVAAEIVERSATEYADELWEDAHPESITGIDRESVRKSAEWQQHIKEFGRRAIYEVRIQHIGYVDAKGRFKEVKMRQKK